MKTKILITGATGFLGKNLNKSFKSYEDKYDITYLGGREIDLTNFEIAANVFKKYQPNIVIHLAAVCGGIKSNSKRPADFLRDNALMAINVVECSKIYGVKRLIGLGSCCGYPKFCPTPFKEDTVWEGYPEETNAPYGISKRLLLLLQQTYREQYGLQGVHLIPANLYGIHDHFDLENSHVIPALINKFVSAVKENKPVVNCWGSGNVSREFLYAGDLAEVIVQVATTEFGSSLPINIGTGQEILIKDLAYLIAELTEFKGEIKFTGEVSDGQPKRQLDVSRAKELLNFEAKTSLEDGLINTINWYKDNYGFSG